MKCSKVKICSQIRYSIIALKYSILSQQNYSLNKEIFQITEAFVKAGGPRGG